MAKFEGTFLSDIYGRELTMSGDRAPTQEEVEGAFNQEFGGDLIFDKLSEDETYIADLKADYKATEGKDYEGSIEDLIEEDFEYWNLVDNNIGAGAFETSTKFANMSKEEKQRTMRRFDVYDRTNITGEGSRSWLEQLKGVGSAVVTDPMNLVGGLGIARLATKTATKGLSRKILEKVMFPAGVGAGIGATADVERQAREMTLEAREEYDPAQTATTAGISSALSVAGPALVSKTAGVVKSTADFLTKKQHRSDVKARIDKKFVDTMGGGAVAKKAAVEETEEAMGHGSFAVGVSKARDVLGNAVGRIKGQFEKKYEDLGELGITADELNGFLRAAISDGVDIPNLTTVMRQVEKGLKTPSDALRDFRRHIGNARYKASQGQGRMADKDALIELWDDAITDLFTSAANRAGKGKQASLIDKEFSDWKTFEKEATALIRGSKSETKLGNIIKALTTNPSKSLLELKRLNSEITKIAKFSGNPELKGQMKSFMQTALKESFFENEGKTLIKFVKSNTGIKTLKELFPTEANRLDDLGDLLKRVEGHDTVRMFWSRVIPTMLAGGMAGVQGGVGLGMFATIGSMVSIESALRSQAFRKMALRAYSNKEIDKKAVNGMVQWLNAKGYNGDALRNQFLGITGVVGGAQVGTQVAPEGGVPLVEGAVDKLKETIGY